MKFALIDKIESVELGNSITATKSLSLAEEYLEDHFPNFPVMPGVLMIEAMTEASAWLIRLSENFAHNMVILKEAKNVRFGQFLRPGQTLTVSAVIVKRTENEVVLKTEGSIDGETRIRAQLTMSCFNFQDRYPRRSFLVNKLMGHLRQELSIIAPKDFDVTPYMK